MPDPSFILAPESKITSAYSSPVVTNYFVFVSDSPVKFASSQITKP